MLRSYGHQLPGYFKACGKSNTDKLLKMQVSVAALDRGRGAARPDGSCWQLDDHLVLHTYLCITQKEQQRHPCHTDDSCLLLRVPLCTRFTNPTRAIPSIVYTKYVFPWRMGIRKRGRDDERLRATGKART